ncbi:uncharacterized protein LOC106636866 [Copidosoma floridanum]|uniref:uncharacterized protein LOC106636866 n=1 Tax=Copidosoma floridanum TaxID=29053 RepID=UPI0006C9A5CF|nr:uncharacterized protein LOC106636866 [Copidosoma floridanum]
MEVLIDCYFDRLFDGLERSSLASRHKRRQLVKFFSDVINSCAEAENLEKADVCERIVRAALRYHNISMADNGSVCMLGKFHNVLYVAAKLCYDWRIEDNELVAKVLNDMFFCEKSFERMFVGAIFGIRVTHFLAGWRSDFDDREENLHALVYFLDHAIDARLEYDCATPAVKRRFIDVPMESCGPALPVYVAVQHGSPDILLLMLRYGATTESDNHPMTLIEILLSRINEYEGEDGGNCPPQLLVCLRVLLRTISCVRIRVPSHLAALGCGIESIPVYEQYPRLAEKKLLPDERSGLVPAELKHLCRCRIRKYLFENWALPHGIRRLQIPHLLMDYLDLLLD